MSEHKVPKRLIREAKRPLNDKNFMDLLVLYAGNIENMLRSAGATPMEDYSYIDLLKLARPYVEADWQKLGSNRDFGNSHFLQDDEECMA